MKEQITKMIENYVAEYQKRADNSLVLQKPLVKFVAANNPDIEKLKEVSFEDHLSPYDVLEDAKSIVVYFVPFTKELAQSNMAINTKNNEPSIEWARTYKEINKMFLELNGYLVAELIKMGHNASFAKNAAKYDHSILKSVWSHRHLGWIGGLGTFGINNLLITEKGSCGRCNSIVTNIELEADVRDDIEYCLYKRNKSCHVCIDNCFSHALSIDGFDRFKCNEVIHSFEEVVGASVCGKCDVGLPCSFRRP